MDNDVKFWSGSRATAFCVFMGATFFLGACSPRSMETPPVNVVSQDGEVTCQLYSLEMVHWDRAVARPERMGVQTADDICRAEGKRILRGGALASR